MNSVVDMSEEAFDPITPVKRKVAPHRVGIATRVEVMKTLTEDLPLNELGLPNYIYRTDLIPANLFEEETTDDERVALLDSASLALDYHEGFPSQQNGTPFWAQLGFEPMTAYTLFIEYLGVVRREEDDGTLTAPVRTLSSIAKLTGHPEERLRELSFLYYWPMRAKAHDLFMLANFQKMRETRALFVEDSHYRKSMTWLKKAEDRLKEIFDDEDELIDLRPNQVFSMMMDLMKLQRISAGLPANGPAVGDDDIRGANLAAAIRSIAKRAGEEAREVSGGEVSIERLLDDPAAMAQLQELVIKANRNQQ